jgi:hypothetical protein
MGSVTHDYEELEREYIQSEISIRQLAAAHNIKSFSTVAQQAKKREWERKRAQFREQSSQRQIAQMANARALRVASLHDTLLDAIQAAVYRFAQNLTSPTYVLRPAEVAVLIDKFLVLSGIATGSVETEKGASVGQINFFEGLDGDAMERLIRAVRPRAALARTVGPDPLPPLEDSRPN